MTIYKPPKEIDFTGNVAQKWRVFKNEFNIFISAAGLDNKPEKRETNTLLNVIGPRGRAVYDTFEYDEGESFEDLATVLEKFENICIPRQNELIESRSFMTEPWAKVRVWFNMCQPLENSPSTVVSEMLRMESSETRL